MMPEMDGPDVCRRVRQELPLANISCCWSPRARAAATSSPASTPAPTTTSSSRSIRKSCAPASRSALRVLGLQQKLAERVAELQAALTNVKQLHGLLPICSYCKRIRGDDQHWQQVEGYIAEHSDAQFSHGICPALLRDRVGGTGRDERSAASDPDQESKYAIARSAAICLTISLGERQADAAGGSSTRHRATVRSQPQVHGCRVQLLQRLGRAWPPAASARSMPGIVIACASLSSFRPCV